MKMFTAIWGDGYTGIDEPAKVENHTVVWFCEERGYTTEMMNDIYQLYIGECLSINDSGIHSIVRIA